MRHEQRMVSGNKADKTGAMPKLEKDISMSNFQIKIAGLVIGIGVSLKMGWCFYTANSLRFRTSLPLWK